MCMKEGEHGIFDLSFTGGWMLVRCCPSVEVYHESHGPVGFELEAKFNHENELMGDISAKHRERTEAQEYG